MAGASIMALRVAHPVFREGTGPENAVHVGAQLRVLILPRFLAGKFSVVLVSPFGPKDAETDWRSGLPGLPDHVTCWPTVPPAPAQG